MKPPKEETPEEKKKREARNKRERERRKAQKEAYESLGLKRVRGSLGGTYWE